MGMTAAISAVSRRGMPRKRIQATIGAVKAFREAL
jgi:hypothetical protein